MIRVREGVWDNFRISYELRSSVIGCTIAFVCRTPTLKSSHPPDGAKFIYVIIKLKLKFLL